MNLKGRDFISAEDFTRDEITYVLNLASELKIKKKKNIPVDILRGKNIAEVFDRPGMFIRAAFDTAAHDLGIQTTYFNDNAERIGDSLDIADTAKAFSRIYDGIIYRGYSQELIKKLAEEARVPIWSGGTEESDPVQAMADILTILEAFNTTQNLKLVYLGNVSSPRARSLMCICAKFGMNFVACSPEKYFPDSAFLGRCEGDAAASGGSITLSEKAASVIRDANIIYADSRSIAGEPVSEEILHELAPYRITEEMLEQAGEGAIIMHPMPVIHKPFDENASEEDESVEMDDEIFNSKMTKTFTETENVMYIYKALIAAAIGTV